MKTVEEIRDKFLNFFSERGHEVVPPSSLISPDSSVLFTTAGMQQFKPYYTGRLNPISDIHANLERPIGSNRAVSIQPVVRTQDIEEVGDPTHLTFFEMMGNFAFRGEYFKSEAIKYAWEFVTEQVLLNKKRLWVTVFAGDEAVPQDKESIKIWEDAGIPDNKIVEFGREDNFWGPTGEEGPCGPTTEIHYDISGKECELGENCAPNCACGRFVELWNIVFNEYFCDKSGKLTLLSHAGVDTGMGLERLAMAVFGSDEVFLTPLFAPVMAWILEYSAVSSFKAQSDLEHHHIVKAMVDLRESGEAGVIKAARIIADHLKAGVFLINAGVVPSNTDKGYVLRRLIRRSALYAKTLRLPNAWPEAVTDGFTKIYAGAYPKLKDNKKHILEVLNEELSKFDKALEGGLKEFEKLVSKKRILEEAISSQEAFRLFETYGFPVELTKELAALRGVSFDEKGFEDLFKRHKELSRAGSENKFGGHGLALDTGELKAKSAEEIKKVTRLHTATHLLQAALRQVLGFGVKQAGSDITPERLRFDFTFPRKLTGQELKEVEDLVNEKIREDLRIKVETMPFKEALKQGALAFAKRSYPESVSVYSIGNFSKEVCGGPHVSRTGEIGEFHIMKEEASSSGVRRIRATARG